VCTVALALAAVCVAASPAAAHGVGGREPTNVRSRIVSVSPPVAGLAVTLIEDGERVEVTNRGPTEVTVLGYDDEPYLRVGPDGVFENTRSPAVFQNRSLNATGDVPSSYDATAEPEWRRVSGDDHVRWHDHRAHRMSGGSFPTTQWTINLTANGRPVVVQGELAWIEAGPWWPWLLLTAVIAALVALAARVAWRLTVTLVLALMCWAEVLHIVGSWSEVSLTLPGRIMASVFSFVAVALGVYAVIRASRDSPSASAPVILVAAVVFVVAGGVGDVSSWFRSQIPSTLPAGTVRALVALAFGGGIGLVIASASHLVPDRTADATDPAELA